MKQTLHVFTIVLAVLGGPVAAQDTCGSQPGYAGDLYAADPATLAAAWLPELERLYVAIPSLSPQEEQWLEEEVGASLDSLDRVRRAISSPEYALREAKRDAGNLLGIVRHGIHRARNTTEQTKGWIRFAYALLEDDASFYLAGLVTEEIIQREVIPDEWTLFAGDTMALQDALRYGRTRLARHVLICTLPAVLGVSMVD